LITSFSF